MYCGKCGKELKQNCSFCPQCGNPITPIPEMDMNMQFEAPQEQKKSLKGLLIALSVVVGIGILAAVSFVIFRKTSPTDQPTIVMSETEDTTERSNEQSTDSEAKENLTATETTRSDETQKTVLQTRTLRIQMIRS